MSDVDFFLQHFLSDSYCLIQPLRNHHLHSLFDLVQLFRMQRLQMIVHRDAHLVERVTEGAFSEPSRMIVTRLMINNVINSKITRYAERSIKLIPIIDFEGISIIVCTELSSTRL